MTLVVLGLLFASPALAQSVPPVTDASRILDIRRFLDICPANDPAFSQILSDLQLFRNGQASPTPGCTEPVSAMAVSQITDELVWSQILRVAYYMDRGRTNYLPWTPLRFYDWVKSKIGGINVIDLGSNVAGSCCINLGGKLFMNVNLADDLNKQLGVQASGALAKLALLLGHEVRHTDGFLHVPGCCPNGSCDQTYDVSNLSAYGVGVWMVRALFLDESIPVGLECDYASTAIGERQDLYQTYTFTGSTVFCDAKPPALPAPTTPDFTQCGTRQLALPSGAIGNAANYNSSFITSGEIVTVYSPSIDAAMTTNSQIGADGRLITQLDGTKLLINSVEAPLIDVTTNQLSAVAPWDPGAIRQVNGTPMLSVEFMRKGLLSQPLFVRNGLVNPGIFTGDGTGTGPAAALNEDHSLNSADNPAAKGSIVQIFVTGTGPFTGVPLAANDGLVMSANIPPLLYTATITVDGQPAEVLYSGQAPGSVAGFSQVNFRVPAGLVRTGALPLRISMVNPNGAIVGVMAAGTPSIWIK